MIALVRYLAADLLRSQRFLLPVLLYVLLLAPLLNGDPGPPPQLWTITALVLYPVSCWLAVTVANTEDPVQRQVTIAAAGPGKVAAGVLVTCLLADAVLIVGAMCWPMISTGYGFSVPAIGAGLLAHVATAATGTAVGLLCARPVLHGIGWTVVVGGGVVGLTATQVWLPPVGPALRALNDVPAVTAVLVLDAFLGVVLAVLAAGVTVIVHNRR